SKRTGPDLARVGGRYSDQWHVDHFYNPRDLVPESIMPAYPWLAHTELDPEVIEAVIRTNRMVGVPYTDEMIELAKQDFIAQADPDHPNAFDVQDRYPGAQVRNFDGNPELTELDAMIAYLQMLGTLVDFSTFEPEYHR
ncbi:MAG: cbb3-type cytochrome c oxidase subunit II, partial [Pseudomonadota bacterium]